VAATEGALAGRIACVDLETTGGHAVRDRVIEAGIVLLRDGAVVGILSELDVLKFCLGILEREADRK